MDRVNNLPRSVGKAARYGIPRTVNIQHLESLTDVVRQITGVPQHDTVPDEVVRRAGQVELVDMAAQALRRLRTPRLAAVSHDLRTPLASARAAVDSLRRTEIDRSAHDRAELLATAAESLSMLDRLVANLLDMSRLRAGVLGLALHPVALEEIVPRCIDALGPLRDRVEGDIPLELPEIVADAAPCWNACWST